MAVLAIVVIFLGRIFRGAVAAFSTALTTVERNSAVEVAMERIVRDLEGLVIDEKVACYKAANVTDEPNGFGFDELWFVTTTTEAVTDFAYHFVRYHVITQIKTAAGYKYKSFALRRDTYRLEKLREYGIDPMGSDREWWEDVQHFAALGTNLYAPAVLLDNVVRFDVFIVNDNGENMGTGLHNEVSTLKEYGVYKPGQYPAFIDIYLQATSDEVMRRTGRMLMLFQEGKADASADAKARTEMVRKSNVLLARIRPLMARGQNLHPLPY